MEQKMLQLQPRLQMLADLVPDGARVADIGTDHGYLPVYLLQRGKIVGAIASDVGQAPLQHAVQTARVHGVDNIDFRLCNGLQGIRPQEIDTVVIAGMGGETIVHILEAARWTAELGRYTLLLQPMTKNGVLRRWLVDNGYRFVQERLVWDKNFLYPIMVVTGGEQGSLDEIEAEYGVCLQKDPLYRRYLQLQITRLQRAADGKRRAGSAAAQQEAALLDERCVQLQRRKEECES